jgi:hypothetical protein
MGEMLPFNEPDIAIVMAAAIAALLVGLPLGAVAVHVLQRWRP